MPSFNHTRSPVRTTFRSAQARRSHLDERYGRRYQNSTELAQQVYALTHPDNVLTFADLERSENVARLISPYEMAIVRLSEALKGDLPPQVEITSGEHDI